MDQLKALIEEAFDRGDHNACAKYIEQLYAEHDAWHAERLQADHDEKVDALLPVFQIGEVA